ncbi:MAG: 16S rRNA (cytosine(1402)-N(4))-methyltransferase RsmH [Christensenellaceae bacterium]|nr:16S rRNA (cytosine(1402)-N(4))-methyltransferase RsmH [Christensenellaceae bacterium]
MSHISVLLEECMAALRPERGGLFIDLTAGGGGHSLALLRRGASELIAVDRDMDAVERCRKLFEGYDAEILHTDFKDTDLVKRAIAGRQVNGILMDLGVSSFQLDEEERGFSYSRKAPLDMRMDKSQELSAYTVVNSYTEKELRDIIYRFGEEKFAPRIAAGIVASRPVTDTMQLADIIKQAIPAPARRQGGNPAKRTFQAVRIEVNKELEGLEETIGEYIDLLGPGGRMAVISFHSLEDRAVKNAMRTAEDPCICPKDFPVCVCGRKPKGKAVTRKPVLPSKEEEEENPRSKSAKLRVFEHN